MIGGSSEEKSLSPLLPTKVPNRSIDVRTEVHDLLHDDAIARIARGIADHEDVVDALVNAAGVIGNDTIAGFTRTVALEAGIASGALNKELLQRPTAMNRLVEPIEVAQAIAWLLSPMSSGVTGINLPVDAGFIAGSTWAAYGGLRESPDP